MATLVLFGRMVLALGIVLLLVYLLARLARRSQRRDRFGAMPGARIEVVARKNLTRQNSLLLVKSEGRRLLVGSTAQQVSLIADLTSENEIDEAPSPDPNYHPNATPRFGSGPPWMVGPGDLRPPNAWDALVNSLRERSVRR